MQAKDQGNNQHGAGVPAFRTRSITKRQSIPETSVSIALKNAELTFKEYQDLDETRRVLQERYEANKINRPGRRMRKNDRHKSILESYY